MTDSMRGAGKRRPSRTLPQMNFAIKASVTEAFLDAQHVAWDQPCGSFGMSRPLRHERFAQALAQGKTATEPMSWRGRATKPTTAMLAG
jgi:hypothetical protein